MSGALPDFFRGDTYPIDLHLTIRGEAEDLTGVSIFFTLKEEKALDDADADAALQHEFVVPASTQAQAGRATLVVPSDKTAALTPGTYICDIQRVRHGNPPDVWTILQQKIRVKADVTRRIA